jgi:hypothetical protein
VSFTGDLEDLPIVDIIQLLHATRKSGILRVKSRKGESNLVFKDGYIVSASHLNNSVRIGTILIERNIITAEILNQTLLKQKEAGSERKPLIVTLLDSGFVKEEEAYKGLERLIEITIVEILTWRRGTFTMEVRPEATTDEYRYYPDKINREVNVNSQGVLMDALCSYDEKMRDGELKEEEIPEEISTVTVTVTGTESCTVAGKEEPAFSAHDNGSMRVGLESLERDKKKRHRQHASGETKPKTKKSAPPAWVVPIPLQDLGRVSVLIGTVVLAFGVRGLSLYEEIDPAADALARIVEPPGPFKLYLTHGLLPTLQALLGAYTAMVGSQLLKLRPWAIKGLEAAAWSGIVVAVINELAELIAAISREVSPSFSYYLAYFISFILWTALWTLPLSAVVWYLRRMPAARTGFSDEDSAGSTSRFTGSSH